MFLNRLALDPRSAQVRRDLGDPYEMHRTLVRAFVGGPDQRPPRFLWRLEPSAVWTSPVVLVQSDRRADWAGVDSIPGYFKSHPDVKEIRLDDLLFDGYSYRFRFFANPTVARNGKRVGLVSECDQIEWLQRQGQRHGFIPEAVMVTGSELLHGGKKPSPISVLKACFEGRLRVVDSVALAAAVRSGIGPGKAFGCGLLSLARR